MHTTYSIAFFFCSLFFCSAIHFDSQIRRRVFLPFQSKCMRSIITFSQNNCFVANIWSNYEYSLWQLYSINALLSQCQFISHTSIYVNFMVIFIDTHKLRATTGKFKNNDPFRQRVNFLSYTQSTRSNLVFDKNNKEIESKYGSRLQIA